MPQDGTSQHLVPFDDEIAEQQIRHVWHEGRWWYSVIDVIALLTGNSKPRQYWFDMKRTIHTEGFHEVSEKCCKLRLRAADGKLRWTDCADMETLQHIIRFVPATAQRRVKRKDRPQSTVYAIGPTDGSMVKIGVSIDLARRLHTHQSGSPVALVVLWQVSGGYGLERRLHQVFASRRAYGEWFDFRDTDVVMAIQAAAAQIEGRAA